MAKIIVVLNADGTLNEKGCNMTAEQAARFHKFDNVEPKKDDEWTEEDFKLFPAAELYKFWNKYDRNRYRVMKTRSRKGVVTQKTDNVAKLKEKLAELGVNNPEIMTLLETMNAGSARAAKASNIMKLFGRDSVSVGDASPLNVAMFYSEKGERMNPDEDLVKFIMRVGNITQKYRKSQVEAWIKEVNESDVDYKIVLDGEMLKVAAKTPEVIVHKKGNKQ